MNSGVEEIIDAALVGSKAGLRPLSDIATGATMQVIRITPRTMSSYYLHHAAL
jgi:hypothetical protein